MPYKGQKPCKCRSHHRPHLHAPCAIDLNAKTAAVAGALRIVRAEAACRKQGTTDQSIAAVRCSDSFIGTTLWAPPARARVGACSLMTTSMASLAACLLRCLAFLAFFGGFFGFVECMCSVECRELRCLPACLPACLPRLPYAVAHSCSISPHCCVAFRCARRPGWLAGWLANWLTRCRTCAKERATASSLTLGDRHRSSSRKRRRGWRRRRRRALGYHHRHPLSQMDSRRRRPMQMQTEAQAAAVAAAAGDEGSGVSPHRCDEGSPGRGARHY
jgi:hypothetical protein